MNTGNLFDILQYLFMTKKKNLKKIRSRCNTPKHNQAMNGKPIVLNGESARNIHTKI